MAVPDSSAPVHCMDSFTAVCVHAAHSHAELELTPLCSLQAAVSAVSSRETPATKSAAAYKAAAKPAAAHKAAVIKYQNQKVRQAAQQDERSHQLPLPSNRTAHNLQSKEQAARSGSSHRHHERYASQPSSRFSNKR